MTTTLEARIRLACEAFAAGRPVLVADDDDRENEVDAILAADRATPEWVAWTVRYSSGYLCAPMPAARADALELPLMVERSQDARGTAYCVSVDAVGVKTGISAAERAQTLRALGAADATPGDLIRPGHVLPLRAADGGVRERAGHTESAVELCRLAGTGEVGAIAELVRDTGETMTWGDAAELAAEYDLCLLTVRDLIDWLEYAEAHSDEDELTMITKETNE